MEIWTFHLFLYYKKTGKIFISPSVLLRFIWNQYHWIQNFISFKWNLQLHNHSIINIVPNRKKTQYFAVEVAFPCDLHNKNSTIGFSSLLRIQQYIICHEIQCLKIWHSLFYKSCARHNAKPFAFYIFGFSSFFWSLWYITHGGRLSMTWGTYIVLIWKAFPMVMMMN